jgi:predicted Zn-ribbon and HTH transcriptional regulator
MQDLWYIQMVNEDAMKRTAKAEEPEIGLVLLPGCRCRCGHEWLPREKGEKPRVCPKCKSPNWDRAKRGQDKSVQGASVIIPASPEGC